MIQIPTCRTCGAQLAPDQRYCLSCGTRVTAPRLDFVAELEQSNRAQAATNGHDPAAATAVHAAGAPALDGAAPGGAAPAPAPSRLDKIGGPMGAAAVVLVALGIGFLIGQAGNDTPVAQRAPVVNIQGGGLPTSAPAPATTDTTASDPAAATDSGASSDASSSDRARGATSRRDAAADAQRVLESTRDIPQSTGTERTGGDINRLRQQPTETATPGAPPPVDDEPAGGGSEATSIG
ncbi:zinc ribbon domain-containing protein [Conexibacter sp. CPCC 206217]|uniref:zinc ribbon domain-containing protein n=1 Tax=Conexibacter sp. CPCC 206217 TaxID=3064574 RepID=UPI0027163EF9|nr:zinc ribbon domain-containing protein [Conexibacter sp. CPCC 206217]MDO8212953.1 zinc ribbon domain-containing protein [Conexibacter sp. CPCC 206217]